MGVLGGVFVLKSGLRILIRATVVPFSVPPKMPKMGHLGFLGGTKNGTWGAQIKILRPRAEIILNEVRIGGSPPIKGTLLTRPAVQCISWRSPVCVAHKHTYPS